MKLYTLEDSAQEMFLPVLEANGHKHATRIFQQFLRNQPEDERADFSLYCVADWDRSTGTLSNPRKEKISVLQNITPINSDITEILEGDDNEK